MIFCFHNSVFGANILVGSIQFHGRPQHSCLPLILATHGLSLGKCLRDHLPLHPTCYRNPLCTPLQEHSTGNQRYSGTSGRCSQLLLPFIKSESVILFISPISLNLSLDSHSNTFALSSTWEPVTILYRTRVHWCHKGLQQSAYLANSPR